MNNMINTDHNVQIPDVSVLALPTGSYASRAALAFRGGSLFDKRQFAATAALVRHPAGDLLIDSGFGRDFERHLRMLPAFRRSAHTVEMPVIDQLSAAGYDLARLAGILLTHSHWDHVSGIADLDVPVLLTDAEIGYAGHAKDDRVFAEVSRDRRLVTYAFDDGPFEGFPVSHDHYGDGSIVIVPAAGHTSGSVIVFVRTPGEKYAFIGDLAWQLEGVQRNVDRPWLMRRLADSDPARVREDLARVSALADRYRVIPAHDARAFAGIPMLSEQAFR
jgi:N-acyl homoserine lactone hydrolase